MAWTNEHQLLKKAGIPIADASRSYRPGGYPRLRLAPLATSFTGRSAAEIQTALTRAIQAGGSRRFRSVGLGRLDAPLADELASVFLGVSECFPGVRVDRINFSADVSSLGYRTLAAATDARDEWPALHVVAGALGTSDIGVALTALDGMDLDPVLQRRARREARWVTPQTRLRDMAAHGSIEFSQCFGHRDCYGTLQSYWALRHRQGLAKGKPGRLIPNQVSAASIVLLHEFGHIVEWAVQAQGDAAYRHVVDALDRGLLCDASGRRLVGRRTLASHGLPASAGHLHAYPASAMAGRPHAGAARRAQRRALGPTIATSLGTYAPAYRDEVFAEAFALSLAARDADLRGRLSVFHDALCDVGIGVRRRTAAGRRGH